MSSNWVISIHDENNKRSGWLGDRFSNQLPIVEFEKVKMLNTRQQMQGTVRRLRDMYPNRRFRVYEANVQLGNITDY